jgi:GDP-L-fucose synthase
MKHVLVTGGSGLIGSQFTDVKYLKPSSGHLNLKNTYLIHSLLNTIKFEGIIHCAAKVGGIKGNMDHQGEFLYENLMMNSNIIESARIFGIKKLVFFSSTCVFPDKCEYPLKPEHIELGPPHSSNYGYAYSKRMGQIQIKAYREQYGLNYFTVIPCNVYGPNDNYDLNNGHVIPSLIHKFFVAKELNEDIEIWGSGNQLREFIFSKDVSKLTEMLYDSYEGSNPVILSPGSEISIRDVVDILAGLFDFKGNIKYDTSKPEGQFRKPSDNSIIKEMFPDFKFTSIEDGLRESVDWFIKNYPNIRK